MTDVDRRSAGRLMASKTFHGRSLYIWFEGLQSLLSSSLRQNSVHTIFYCQGVHKFHNFSVYINTFENCWPQEEVMRLITQMKSEISQIVKCCSLIHSRKLNKK